MDVHVHAGTISKTIPERGLIRRATNTKPTEVGWQPRDMKEMVLSMAESMIELKMI